MWPYEVNHRWSIYTLEDGTLQISVLSCDGVYRMMLGVSMNLPKPEAGR